MDQYEAPRSHRVPPPPHPERARVYSVVSTALVSGAGAIQDPEPCTATIGSLPVKSTQRSSEQCKLGV